PIGAARRRPHALLAGLVTGLHALIEALVRPDVYEAVGAAELHAAREHYRRELDAIRQLLAPALGGGRQRATLQRVVADLKDRAHAPGLRRRYEVERRNHLRAHGADELLDLRRPVRILRRLGADARALREVLVPPNVDDLVERPDLRVQEGRQRGVLLALLVRLAVPL